VSFETDSKKRVWNPEVQMGRFCGDLYDWKSFDFFQIHGAIAA